MSGRYRVLHVDDDPDVLDASRRILSRAEKIITQTTTDPAEALERLESEEIDCLVSDSMTLPDGEPFVVAARARAADVPIVLFTARPWEDVSEAAMTAGVTEYVQKGVNRTESRPLFQRVCSLAARELSEFDDVDATEQHRGTTREREETDHGWQTIGHHDWDTYHELSSSIVLALEAFTDEPATESEPLFEAIDADALESLLRPDRPVTEGTISVRFSYQGYELTVRSDGSIAVRQSVEDGLRT